ncbi:hypothetical protein PC128_g11245 [Phytophthora cactorum]|nr:hypothetical protein PC120_g10631 [Phytophthora cactorum]KAG3190553.1 hypothetical protein PC128_g11245 [Phytophthora cactorum]
MPRRASNRVGVEEVEKWEKGEEEPHADEASSPSRQMKASASTSTLEAAKAQRRKELLRKKKVERRAHAKQRRHDEKKQKREMEKMLEEDAPAVDRVDTLTPCFGDDVRTLETSTSTRLLDGATIEILPKRMKEPSHDSAALTIQKALKKRFKKCKTMFRQSPRVFAEEIVVAAPAKEENPPIDRLLTDPELGPHIEMVRPEVVVPPLDLPQLKPSSSPRSRSLASSSSRSCFSSCSCSDQGTCPSCSSCSSCSSSSSSSETSSTSRRRRRSNRTARSPRSHRRNSRHHTTTHSSRRHTLSHSGPSSSLLPEFQTQEDKKYGAVHHFMATRIQAQVRGYHGRAKARRRQLELDEEIKDEALHELQQEAIVKIQTRARGVLARKKMPISDKERRRRRRRRSQVHSNPSLSPRSVHGDSDVEHGIYSDPDEVGEWPQELDLEVLDDWQDLNQLSTTTGDSVTQDQFLSRGRLRVFCGTWNMHAKKPTDDLRLWIRLNKYHIVAVGSEECVNSIAKSVVFTSKKSWEDQLRNTLGDDYILVASHALTAIHNVVFVHTSILPLLGNIRSDAVATGLGNQLGNKGGVGIAFTVGYTSFAFVNCHFDAHQRNVSKRNGNFHRINHELKLSPSVTASLSQTSEVTVTPLTPGSHNSNGLQGLGRTSVNRFSMPTVVNGVSAGSKRTVSELFDRVFWFGDLNYRINGTRRMVDTLLLRNQYEVLYANDQLQREMKAGNVFPHFREGQPNFRPTYKFDKRSDVYDSSAKQRIPSWTDRVLYLSNEKLHDIELLSYRSQTNFRTSDHRPVCATFQVNFSAIGVAESLQSPRQSGQSHDNQVTTSQACSIQ